MLSVNEVIGESGNQMPRLDEAGLDVQGAVFHSLEARDPTQVRPFAEIGGLVERRQQVR